MRVCFDTNVLIQVFTRRSPFNEIRDALTDGALTLVVSNEILFEYEEVITNEQERGRGKGWRCFLKACTSFTAMSLK